MSENSEGDCVDAIACPKPDITDGVLIGNPEAECGGNGAELYISSFLRECTWERVRICMVTNCPEKLEQFWVHKQKPCPHDVGDALVTDLFSVSGLLSLLLVFDLPCILSIKVCMLPHPVGDCDCLPQPEITDGVLIGKLECGGNGAKGYEENRLVRSV